MKSWRTLVTAGLTVGAAAVIFPLTAGSAAAEADDWSLAGGGYPTNEACIEDGYDYIDDTYHDYTEFQCFQNGSTWAMRVR